MIVIVDYGMGNIGSLHNMLHKIGAQCVASAEIPVIEKATALILPGVGSFDNAMAKLYQLQLEKVLNYKVLEQKTPILGICLGMQLLAQKSEEGSRSGLGWLNAEVVRFSFDNIMQNGRRLTVPHMGWNTLALRKSSTLFEGLDDGAMFYFVHSYHLHCRDQEDVLATSRYGIEFNSVIRKNNIMGVQFHPEKSLRFGRRLLDNFVREMQL